MSLHTEFEGAFTLDRRLTPQHSAYLSRFSETRRMQRVVSLLDQAADPIREAVGLPVGPEGAYYVGSTDYAGMDFNNPNVLDSNQPPEGQPGLWCLCVQNADATVIVLRLFAFGLFNQASSAVSARSNSAAGNARVFGRHF